MATGARRYPQIIKKYENEILTEWIRELRETGSGSEGRLSERDLQQQARELLTLIQQATERSDESEVESSAFNPLREFLEELSRTRAFQGFTTSETAIFVFSLKKVLFNRLRAELAGDAVALSDELWAVTQLIDNLGLYTVRVFQQSREDVIRRQQDEMLELSTPVVKLWDGVLALPMIGTLDSSRTQIVMESLLVRIVETESEIAIIDITGVPTVDTLVAQHLLKTVTAIRLMGAECIISGIRPQIAQTIVHLGVDLGNVVTKSSLSDALSLALHRRGLSVVKTSLSGGRSWTESQS